MRQELRGEVLLSSIFTCFFFFLLLCFPHRQTGVIDFKFGKGASHALLLYFCFFSCCHLYEGWSVCVDGDASVRDATPEEAKAPRCSSLFRPVAALFPIFLLPVCPALFILLSLFFPGAWARRLGPLARHSHIYFSSFFLAVRSCFPHSFPLPIFCELPRVFSGDIHPRPHALSTVGFGSALSSSFLFFPLPL